jgi:hypothetical protein
VADRENFRIEKFDLDCHYLGEISNVGRIYSLKLVNHILWASTFLLACFFPVPDGRPRRLVSPDPASGSRAR